MREHNFLLKEGRKEGWKKGRKRREGGELEVGGEGIEEGDTKSSTWLSTTAQSIAIKSVVLCPVSQGI